MSEPMRLPFAELEHAPELLATARAMGRLDADAVMRLRKRWSAELVNAAVDLLNARRKARAKFGEAAEQMYVDVEAVEQATSLDVARYKAKRWAEAGVEQVWDLCCGIGGDAMAMAEVAAVVAVDQSFERAWMARHNARLVTGRTIAAVAADVTQLNLAPLGDIGAGLRGFHVDPSRRQQGRRSHGYHELEPGPEFIERLLATCETGAVKLGPGVAFEELPGGEVELIQRGGTLVQAVLWTGRLARAGEGERTATMVPMLGGEACSFTAEADAPIDVDPPGRYLMTVEPAIERAGLLGALGEELGIAMIHPALGLFTSEALIDSPWLTAFERLETLPWRLNKVKQWLAAHGAGVVEVKTRGQAVEPDAVQRRLRGPGDQPFTVHILREERKVVCHITRRVA